MDLVLNAQDQPFEYNKVLEALNAAQKTCGFFEVNESLDVSLEEIAHHADSIIQFHSVIDADPVLFRCDFSVQGEGYDKTQPTACVWMTATKIGRRVFGLIIVTSGTVQALDDGRFSLLASDAKIEQKIISDDEGVIQKDDLVQAFEVVEKIYADNFEVITMFDKSTGESKLE